MMEKDHDIVPDQNGKEQPSDKERAPIGTKTEPGHMPQQPENKEDELQPVREKSGF